MRRKNYFLKDSQKTPKIEFNAHSKKKCHQGKLWVSTYHEMWVVVWLAAQLVEVLAAAALGLRDCAKCSFFSVDRLPTVEDRKISFQRIKLIWNSSLTVPSFEPSNAWLSCPFGESVTMDTLRLGSCGTLKLFEESDILELPENLSNNCKCNWFWSKCGLCGIS